MFKPTEWGNYRKDCANGIDNFQVKENSIEAKIIKTIGNILNSALVFVSSFFGEQRTADKVGEAIVTMLNNIPWSSILMNALSGVINIGTWIIDLGVSLISLLCEGLATGFADMENDSELIQAVKSVFIAIGNLIISIIEGCLELLINAIPNFLIGLAKTILDLLAGLMVPILGEDFYNSATQGLWGKDSFHFNYDVDLGRIKDLTPHLATGTGVPASYGEFLAILGDNKRETEVVSPLSTIKQALIEAFAEIGGTGGNQEITVICQVDRDVLFKQVVKANYQDKRRRGKSVLA
jgi:hypothetical protein